MSSNKRARVSRVTATQRAILREYPTAVLCRVVPSSEPRRAPEFVSLGNPYHGAAAATADSAAHASTPHECEQGHQPGMAVPADGHGELDTAHGHNDHEQYSVVPDQLLDAEMLSEMLSAAEDTAQSAAGQDSLSGACSAHIPELLNVARVDGAAGGSAGCGVDTEITRYIQAIRRYFDAQQPPMLRVSQGSPFSVAAYAMPTEWDARNNKLTWRRHCVAGVVRVATQDGAGRFVYFCNCCTESQVCLRNVQVFHACAGSTGGVESARCLHARALQRMLGPDAAGPQPAVESSTTAGLMTAVLRGCQCGRFIVP
jgi:hypothetical protein